MPSSGKILNTASVGAERHVLVVEDEPLLLMMAIDLVEEAGFDPVSARNTDEAMLVLEARSTICIVFTDVEMPLGATNGLSLAFTVRDRWPHIELIITSGHTMIDEVDLPVRGRFFSKPYHAPEIIRAMHLMVAR